MVVIQTSIDVKPCLCWNCIPRTVSTSETVFSEESVLSEKSPEPQKIVSPSQTPPTPTRRINPPAERVQTRSYPPPELPPCGHTLMSISAISEQGVIYAMTHQAGLCSFYLLLKQSLSASISAFKILCKWLLLWLANLFACEWNSSTPVKLLNTEKPFMCWAVPKMAAFATKNINLPVIFWWDFPCQQYKFT